MKSKHKRQLPEWDRHQVLVIREHHGTFYMDASSREAFEKSVLRILKGRLAQEDMFFFSDEVRKEAERAISKKNAGAAWQILLDRSDIDDERVNLEQIETHYYGDED